MEYMGVAFSDVSFGEDEVVFPHVCTKNCKLSVNYGDNRSDDWIQFAELQKDDTLDVDFAPIYFSRLDRKVLVRGLVPPSSKSECTVDQNFIVSYQFLRFSSFFRRIDLSMLRF